MRVAVLTTGYPRWPGDVAGCFVEGFVDVLRVRGHHVTVFAPESHERRLGASPASREPYDGSSTSHASHASHAPLDMHRVAYVRPRSLARTFYGAGVPDNVRDPRAWPGLLTYPLALRHAARGRWDAAVAHFGVPCGLVAATLDTPRVLTVWHSADVALAARLPRRTLRPLLATGTHWFVREQHRRALDPDHTLDPRRVRVSPMGVHAPRSISREEARVRLGLDTRPVVLFLGRLVRIKGADVLARALASRDDVQLVIAGDGPERARLEQLAPRARFLGHVRDADKDAALAGADVVVLPSRRGSSGRTEGAPLVATEAALAGRPRVVSRSIGLGEDEAWVFEDEDVAGLARAIEAALEAGRHATREECARTRASRLTWEALGPLVESTVLDAFR
jgi:glycosyltransferase involved in cell wall biosynthesis